MQNKASESIIREKLGVGLMARVTIEDCMKVIASRFELVVLAAQRAKDIADGSPIAVERDNDKNPVVALREISLGLTDPLALEESVVKKHQRHQANELVDKPEDDDMSETMSEMAAEMKSFEVADGIDEEDYAEEKL